MTEGQAAAFDQVLDIAAAGSALEILAIRSPSADRPNLVIEASVSCGHYERRPIGIPLRSRERFLIFIPPGFPFEIPSVETPHRRFAGFPHVQWGKHLCLYQAPSTEWSACDGMYGFADRLDQWLERAARGELDPAGAPLHPPVAYMGPGPYRLVIPRVDTPTVGSDTWFGYAHLSAPTEWRVDLTGWSSMDSPGTPRCVAAAILLSQLMPFEFPSRVADLITALAERGISRRLLFLSLQCALLQNEDDAPLYVIIGAPMRGIAGSGDFRQHLTAWYVEPVIVTGLRLALNRYSENAALAEIGDEVERIIFDWASSAPVVWCNVRDDRPEIVIRRDNTSRMSWFRGRCVSLWGCGALGGQVAEFVARAGARKVILHDSGAIAPGLLARQPYYDRDLGRYKAQALAERLARIRPDLEIDIRTQNLLKDPLDAADWTDAADVVIETTASGVVREKLEFRRARTIAKIPVVSMMIGHHAEYGVITVTPTNYSGGPIDALRRAKLEACNRPSLREFADEFWPRDRHPIFQPEPGCSDPTFIGSAADASALAGLMINLAAESLRDGDDSHASGAFVSQPKLSAEPNFAAFSWPCDIVVNDPESGHEIRIAAGAWADIEGWSTRSMRTSGSRVETGGLLFGERDDAIRTIWVTEVIGPPADSRASEQGFVCGISGTDEANKEKLLRSRNSVAYIGMWHTHPEGEPLPSGTDLSAAEHLVTQVKDSPSRLLLLIVGGSKEHRRIGPLVFKKSDFDAVHAKGESSRLCAIAVPRVPRPSHRVGLALSGGGSRAIAFHLGCMRALHDRGILDQTKVISAVSGGSLIAGMYAYQQSTFEEFDARVVDLLREGLSGSILSNAFLSTNVLRTVATILIAGGAALGATIARNLISVLSRFRYNSVGALATRREIQPPLRRWMSRTLAFEKALQDRLFGTLKVTDPRRNGIDVVFNACELRTGTAMRFGSRESACWRFGKVHRNDVRVSFAVAASAAYPALLPAIDCEMMFTDKRGERKERVIIADGGVYDNLGLSCLQPGRSEAFSSNVFSPDYLICCDAGPGQFDGSTYPFWWPGRMRRSFETTFRRSLESSYAALHSWTRTGAIRGFALLFLGQQDERLPYVPSDLVRREEVTSYPTDFAPMPLDDIERLANRGEQLARLLTSQYLADL